MVEEWGIVESFLYFSFRYVEVFAMYSVQWGKKRDERRMIQGSWSNFGSWQLMVNGSWLSVKRLLNSVICE